MSYEIEKLTARDYDEALSFLNNVYLKNGQPNEFDRELPLMWKRDDEHMSKHLVCREAGKIVALVGVYPLTVFIGDKKLRFSTVGNVATREDFRGKGYMKSLMTAAMEELTRLGADASRLGGFRQRYNRYGFETAGSAYLYSLTERNIRDYFDGSYTPCFTFREIARSETGLLSEAWQIFRQTNKIRVDRICVDDFYLTCTAWRMKPVGAFDREGKLRGYLVVSEAGNTVAEQCAYTPVETFEMLCSFLTVNRLNYLSIRTAPWETELNVLLGRLCEDFRLTFGNNFKIINFKAVTSALLKLKASTERLQDGSSAVAIDGYGTLEITVREGVPTLEVTSDTAELTVDRLTATRLFYGPFAPKQTVCGIDSSSPLNNWFPLPLSWNNQDRV